VSQLIIKDCGHCRRFEQDPTPVEEGYCIYGVCSAPIPQWAVEKTRQESGYVAFDDGQQCQSFDWDGKVPT
jgi:hypothetical protein